MEFGKSEDEGVGQYIGLDKLEWYVNVGREEEKSKRGGGGGLAKDEADLAAFKAKYRTKKFVPAQFQPGEVVEGFVGIDGGSTSTKAVLMSKDHKRRILAKTYQLSKGNPIEDTIEVLQKLDRQIRDQGVELKILGVGTTGYAKDILKDVIGADAALVETVAHTEAGLHFYEGVDVICDVGGQDIKIIILKNNRVKDFKLNTQCSAGNGYFLQSTAQGFNVPVEQYADTAFGAKGFPSFGYGCAVFMQSDIVDFQRQGWKPEEIMAGLCNVLPKNIWLYVSQIPNLSAIGSRFLLQGGTQYNLAAVKAQVDFIESRFKGKETPADVIVHEHCGEAGAIGAALEAGRLWDNGRKSTFIGLDQCATIQYKTTREEATRCYFCKNKCLRTFIDVKTTVPNPEYKPPVRTKVPLEAGAQRLIIATCEKGTVENIEEMRGIKGNLDKIKKANPNFVEMSAKGVFRVPDMPLVSDPAPKFQITAAQKKRAELLKKRGEIRIGMPRVLNMYSMTPVFTGYFASLGIKAENLVYSEYTSEELYKEGAKSGAIDPCFPSKLGIPHVHNLLYKVHAKKPLDIIFFPMIDCLTSELQGTQASRSCPTVAATPEAVKAAFTKEGDLFKEKGVLFMDTFVNISKPELLERQMFEQFQGHLGPNSRREQTGRGARLSRAGFVQQLTRCAAPPAKFWNNWSARTGWASCCWGGRITTIPASTTRFWRNSRSSATRSSPKTACPSTTTSSGAFSATMCCPARSIIPCRSWMSGRTPTARTPAARYGPPNMWRGIPTWWRWSFPASSAAMTPPSIRWWKRSWSTPARRTSASRISTRTSLPARSGFASRPSATS